jgi:hypothetical protein
VNSLGRLLAQDMCVLVIWCFFPFFKIY